MQTNTTAFMVYYYISIRFYNNVSTGIDSLFVFFCCFKNISDVEKAIENHSLATNSSFLVYQTEHEFNAKGIYEFASFASDIFWPISIFFLLFTLFLAFLNIC